MDGSSFLGTPNFFVVLQEHKENPPWAFPQKTHPYLEVRGCQNLQDPWGQREVKAREGCRDLGLSENFQDTTPIDKLGLIIQGFPLF